MITLYDTIGAALVRRDDGSIIDTTVWIDLFDPSEPEETSVEAALQIEVPTRAEMREIEQSNRFYEDGGTYYLTSFVVHTTEAERPVSANITFVLAGNRVVTIRYSEPKAIELFADRACRPAGSQCTGGAAILIGLLETIIQRQADLIEHVQDEIEKLAPQIFESKMGAKNRSRRLDIVLKALGRCGDITSRCQESMTSLNRTLQYFANAARARADDDQTLARIDVASRDISALGDNLRALAGRSSFLLDAALGVIANEQNQIIKLFSVMAVMLMPPTLVASIYGMNFEHMPEIKWEFGYPIALAAMVVSAVVPYVYFRRRGWL